jgi:hypothetical protein
MCMRKGVIDVQPHTILCGHSLSKEVPGPTLDRTVSVRKNSRVEGGGLCVP